MSTGSEPVRRCVAAAPAERPARTMSLLIHEATHIPSFRGRAAAMEVVMAAMLGSNRVEGSNLNESTLVGRECIIRYGSGFSCDSRHTRG